MSTERATELTWKILQVLHPQFEVGEEENEYLAKPDFDLILPIVQQAYAAGERAAMDKVATKFETGGLTWLTNRDAERVAKFVRALPVEAAPATPEGEK